MHIAYVSDQRYPNMGTDTAQIVTMCSAFGAAGARVTLYYLHDGRRPAVSGRDLAEHYEVEDTFQTVAVPCRRSLMRGVEKLTVAGRAAALIARSGADCVYSRNLPAIVAGLVRTDLPAIYETYRPWPLQSRPHTALFHALRPRERFRGLILHSQLAGDAYRSIGYADDRVLVALNGYNPAVLGEPLTQAEARARLGLDDGFTVTYGGNVMPSKGLGVVLDLAERLPEVTFHLVGYRSHNPIVDRAAGLKNVHVYSWRKMSEVSAFLYAADVLIIPPTAAPLQQAGHTVLPIKSFYYLAAGRPVLAGDTPDVREVFTHGENALLVEPRDLDAAESALRRLMDAPDERARLGANALSDGQRYTWDARAERVLHFLEQRLR